MIIDPHIHSTYSGDATASVRDIVKHSRKIGLDAIAIADKVFTGKSLANCDSHTLNYGHITENTRILDEVMVGVMKAPKTFTREDVVEINTHGGIAVMNEIFQL